MKLPLRMAATFFWISLVHCTAVPSSLSSRCEAIEVDPMRELVVADPRVVSDPSVDFAHVAGSVLASAGSSVPVWMGAWQRAEGPDTGAQEAAAAWAQPSPGAFDPARSPFELVAVVDRVDLSSVGRPGELRFVYGLVIAGVRRPLTVAIELDLPASRTIEQWASAWHALGSLSGDAGNAATLALAIEVLAQPAQGQIRIQDATVTPPLLLELDVRPGMPITQSPLFNQPSPSTRAVALGAFVSAHAVAVLGDEEVVPGSMLASSIQAGPADAALPGVDPALAQAFVLTTCRGCHVSQPGLDGTFHISPLRRGQASLSAFLVGTGAAPGELSRRAEVLRGLLCNE